MKGLGTVYFGADSLQTLVVANYLIFLHLFTWSRSWRSLQVISWKVTTKCQPGSVVIKFQLFIFWWELKGKAKIKKG